MFPGRQLVRQAADRSNLRQRFKVACRALGPERRATLTIHHGRHSFVSHALKHRTLAEVRDAVGHFSVAITSVYLHVATDDDGEVRRLFDFDAA